MHFFVCWKSLACIELSLVYSEQDYFLLILCPTEPSEILIQGGGRQILSNSMVHEMGICSGNCLLFFCQKMWFHYMTERLDTWRYSKLAYSSSLSYCKKKSGGGRQDWCLFLTFPCTVWNKSFWDCSGLVSTCICFVCFFSTLDDS